MAKRMNLFIPLMLMISLLTGCFGSSSNSYNPYPRPEIAKSRVYYLCIGINRYESDDIEILNGAVNDALGFANVFASGKNLGVSEFRCEVLTSDGNVVPTKGNIESAIYSLLSDAKEEDIFVFTFSGHGFRSANGRTEYIAPYDTRIDVNQRYNEEKKEYEDYYTVDESTLISDQQLREWIQNENLVKPNTCIFIIDSCFSGGMIKTIEESRLSKSLFFSNGSIISKNLAEITNKNIIAMSAADVNQESLDIRDDNPSKSHGLFSKYLLQGLSSRYINTVDTDKNYIITAEELFSYAEKEMEIYFIINKGNVPATHQPYLYSYPSDIKSSVPLFVY